MPGFSAVGELAVGELPATVTSNPPDPPTGGIDATDVPAARVVIFAGGIRTVVFTGGTRTVRF